MDAKTIKDGDIFELAGVKRTKVAFKFGGYFDIMGWLMPQTIGEGDKIEKDTSKIIKKIKYNREIGLMLVNAIIEPEMTPNEFNNLTPMKDGKIAMSLFLKASDELSTIQLDEQKKMN